MLLRNNRRSMASSTGAVSGKSATAFTICALVMEAVIGGEVVGVIGKLTLVYQSAPSFKREEKASTHNGQKSVILGVEIEFIFKEQNEAGKTRIRRIESRTGLVICFEEANQGNGKGYPAYGWRLEEDAEVPGDVITRFVQEYLMPTVNGKVRIANMATVVVFGRSDEPDWEAVGAEAFAARGHIFANPNVRQINQPRNPVLLPGSDADNGLPY